MSINIFKDGVLVDVNVRYWSGARALSAEDLGLDEGEIVDAFKLGRKYLIPEEVVRGWRTVEGRARYAVEKNSFRFPIGNARFITKKRFEKVVKQLEQCQTEFNKLVEDLLENYEPYRQQMIPVYTQAAEAAFSTRQDTVKEFGPDYDPEAAKKEFVEKFMARIATFYPSVDTLKGSFSLTWDVYAIAMPRMKQSTGEAIIEEEKKLEMAEVEYQKQIHEKMDSFIQDVVKTLRQETLELCARVKQNISDGKVVTRKSVQSIQDFIEKFESLNFVGDSAVELQLEKLRKEFLNVHDTEAINDDEVVLEEFKRRISMIADAATDVTDLGSVTGEYKRKIQWDEEVAKAA